MYKLILLKLLVLQSCLVFSQQAFYNSGNLRIHSGASVTIFGDLTNSSGAVLVNNGNLYSKLAIVKIGRASCRERV